MDSLHVHTLDAIEQLAAISDRWNDLWRRSSVTSPMSRAEFISQWIQQFAPGQRFQTIVVERGNRLLAALPMVSTRLAKIIPAGSLPRNEWNGAGDLLVDETEDARVALRLIATTLNKLGWPLYRFSFVRSDSSAWQQFMAALAESGLRFVCRPSYEVTYVEIPARWEAYRQTWSKGHRRNMRRYFRDLEAIGKVRLQRSVPASAAEAEPLFQKAFLIEDAGWKGGLGTSLLQTGTADFVRRLSRLLVPLRELEIAFLEVSGEAIAFEILWNAKGVLHSYKVSYDEQFHRYSPGQLLMHELLREACETHRCEGYDCLGPTSAGLQRWGSSTYQVSQLTIAPRRLVSRGLMFAYQLCRQTDRSIAEPRAPFRIVENDKPETSERAGPAEHTRTKESECEPHHIDEGIELGGCGAKS